MATKPAATERFKTPCVTHGANPCYAYDLATGRLVTMLAAGSDTPFTWNYLPGSDLKSSLMYPNGLTASWTYDANRQLLQVCNATPTNVISQYDYTYDAAGRRVQIGRSGSAMSENRTDAYGYNSHGELVSGAKLGGPSSPTAEYAYQYDDIGNRITSLDLGTNRTYTANSLNQYTLITEVVATPSPSQDETFIPQFDDDGNQTLIKTSTGIWSVTYNGENRPILWENVSTNSPTSNPSTPTLISMSYDRMGRRVTKNNQRFVYDGYLQISNFELSTFNFELQTFVWDPTEPVATRPLAWDQDGTLSYYVFDGDKNVCDVIAKEVAIVVHYEYALFGLPMAVSDEQTCSNPWCFSAEYLDAELMQYYYNYRCLDPGTGRWISVDPILDEVGVNGYAFCMNNPIGIYDIQGLISPAVPMSGIFAISAWVLKLGMPYLGVDGIIQIKGRRAGVFCEIVGRMSARSFVDSVARFDDCSIELIEFRGHGDNGFMIPFVMASL